MINDSGHSTQRFEAKYLISERQALAVRNYITPYTTTDPHAGGGDDYLVSSLYLDTPGLAMYWSSVRGEKNRFKLRIREYGAGDATPLFFEIKRRVNDVVIKDRARVHRECARSIVALEPIHEGMLVAPDPRQTRNLRQFQFYMETAKASPRVVVRYRREAHLDRQGSPTRITMDRDLQFMPAQNFAPERWSQRERWQAIVHVPVILEIKFSDAMPPWVRRLIQHFELQKGPGRKYVTCMTALKRGFLSTAPSSSNRLT